MAGMYEDALADRDQWRERATKAEEAAESYREAYVANIELRFRLETLEAENVELRFRVETLELELAEANRRKAGYLPEGVPDSKRLKPGQPVRASIKRETEITHERDGHHPP